MLTDQGAEGLIGDLSRPFGVDHDRHRLGDTNGICQLDLAFVCQICRDNILGDIAGHIGGGAVDLGRVLARIAAAAVTAHPPVGIDDDLPSGKPGIGLGAPSDEPTRGIYVVHDTLRVQELSGDDVKDHLLDDILPQLLERDVGAVLCGYHNGVHPSRLTIHILHGHLGFPIRAEVVQDIFLSHLGQSATELMGQHDWHGHHLRGLPGRISEHQPLIAGPLNIHPQRDIRRLFLDGCDHRAGFIVEAVLGPGIPGIADRLPDDLWDIDVTFGGYFSSHKGQAGRY